MAIGLAALYGITKAAPWLISGGMTGLALWESGKHVREQRERDSRREYTGAFFSPTPAMDTLERRKQKLHSETTPLAGTGATTDTGKTQTHEVQPGDTVSGIAQQYGVSPDQITGMRSGDPNLIHPGEQLTVGGEPTTFPGGRAPQQDPQTGFDPSQLQEALDSYQTEGVDLPDVPDVREDIDWMRDKMAETPEVPDLRGEMERLRQEYQVEPLEQQISEYDREMMEAQQRWEEEFSREQGRPVTLEQMRGRTGEMSREMEREIGFLEQRKQVAVNELNQKYENINMMMNLEAQQYEMARQDYEMKFDKAFNITGMLLDTEMQEFQNALNLAQTESQLEQVRQQTSLANWQIATDAISNAIQRGAMQSVNDLSAEQKAKLAKQEAQAGLPTGFTETLLNNMRPQEEHIQSIVSEDQTQISSIIRQPGGSIRTETHSTGLPAAQVTTDDGEVVRKTASDLDLNSASQQLTHFRTDWIEGMKDEINRLPEEQRVEVVQGFLTELDAYYDRVDRQDLIQEMQRAGIDLPLSIRQWNR